MCCAGASRADVYVIRDASGALVLTNVPAATEASTTERVYADGDRDDIAISPAPARFRYWGPRFSPVADDGRYDDLIREVADRHGLEFALVKAVVRAESGFDPFAISRKGAQGLMQLMPATARMHGVRESFRPRDNIDGGVRHLRIAYARDVSTRMVAPLDDISIGAELEEAPPFAVARDDVGDSAAGGHEPGIGSAVRPVDAVIDQLALCIGLGGRGLVGRDLGGSGIGGDDRRRRIGGCVAAIEEYGRRPGRDDRKHPGNDGKYPA